MSAKKLYDVVAVTGEYTDNFGNTKKSYQNLGAVLEGEKGPYLLLEPWLNPAGLAEPGKPCFLALYEPRPKSESAPGGNGGDPGYRPGDDLGLNGGGGGGEGSPAPGGAGEQPH